MVSPPVDAAAPPTLTLRHDGVSAALLTVTAPATGPAARKRIAAVVDVSYSMHGAANDHGDEITKYFSKLDIVKHGLKTALAGLSDGDSFSLVSFSSAAELLLPPTRLDTAGRAAAAAAVDALAPQGATALWAGLRAGLDALRAGAAMDAGALPVLLLLTDGDPSESPPGGECAAYSAYVKAHGLEDTTLLAFGFGYDVKSLLLKQLADAAGGASYFGFIPDGSMNATVFNCAFANLHVTCAADMHLAVRLRLAEGEAAPELRLAGGFAGERLEEGGAVRLLARPGALQLGGSRNLLLEGLPARGWDRLEVELSYRSPGASPAARTAVALPADATRALDAVALAAARHRLAGADAIARALRLARMDPDAARAIIREAAAPMLAEPPGREPPVLGDLLGEVSGALATPQAFHRWGEHFLRFCPTASLFEQRLNFKDPGGLAFGGAPFQAQLAALDEAFTRVGVPTPSLVPPAVGRPAPGGAARGFGAPAPAPALGAARPGAGGDIPIFTATVFADRFNNVRGGCFAHHCAVALPGGRATTVGALRPGDAVAAGVDGAATARIRCIVDYESPVLVVTLSNGGPTLTPWHPVRLPGAAGWQFPARLAGADAPTATIPRVRTFVLEAGSPGCMVIDGVAAATLGHGLTDDDVIRHEFYGTQRVLDDLAAFPGWAAGHVVMTAADEVYDGERLVAYRPAAAAAGADVVARVAASGVACAAGA